MALRYWVGGTASWDGTAGTKWALTSGGAGGQAVPTSADDVFFDANSGANTVTIATGNTGAKTITCTGFTGTLAGTASISVAGSVTLVAGMTHTYSGTYTITATGTFTSAGKTIGRLGVNGTGITLTQGDALTATVGIIVTSGTYTTNNNNITITDSVGNIGISVTGTSTRTLTLGSSTISITNTSGSTAHTAFDATTTTNLTFNANTSSITCVNNGSATTSFKGGGLTFNNVTFTNSTTSVSTTTPDAIAITGANTFANLTFTGRTSAGVGRYTFAANQTVTGTLTASAGTNASMRTFLVSDTIGTARTLTCAAVSLTDVDFQDITAAGAASPFSGTRLGNCTGNTNVTFPAAKTVYWNLAGTQNFNAVAWATSSGGAPASTNFPLPQDTAIVDNTGSAGTITINGTYNLGTVDMSARTSAFTLSFGAVINVFGDWKNNVVTFSGNARIGFSGSNNQQITSAGRTFPNNAFYITKSSASASVTLQDALAISGGTTDTLTLLTGTFNANNFNVTLSFGNCAPGSGATGQGTRTLTMGSGTWTIAGSSATAWNNGTPSGLTLTGSCVISMTGNPKTFVGGSFNYSGITLNQGSAGTLTISGSNTFSNITNTYSATGATTITFTSGTTQTVSSFTATGAAGKVLTINTTTTSAATLSAATGIISVDYLSLSYSTATGGATWYAGYNSTDGGNNTGWIFTSQPFPNFLTFFFP